MNTDEFSLWEWLELKNKKSVDGVIKFKPLTNSIDNIFCELHKQFETQKWNLRFSTEIGENQLDEEVTIMLKELYNEFKLTLKNTIVKIPSET